MRKAVFIVPSLVKGGFIFGAEGGNGVLLKRTGPSGWSAPAFYAMGSASFGLQIGLQKAEIVMLIMSDRALRGIQHDKFKIGAGAGITAITLSSGAEGATSGRGGDIVVWTSGTGAYGGLTFNGSAIKPLHDWNRDYYGHRVSVRKSFPAACAIRMRAACRRNSPRFAKRLTKYDGRLALLRVRAAFVRAVRACAAVIGSAPFVAIRSGGSPCHFHANCTSSQPLRCCFQRRLLPTRIRKSSTPTEHAGYAAAAADIAGVHAHLHHALNCLVGPGGNGFDAKEINPCAHAGNGSFPTHPTPRRRRRSKLLPRKHAKASQMAILPPRKRPQPIWPRR